MAFGVHVWLQSPLQSLIAYLPLARRAESRVVIRSVRDYQIHDIKLAAWVFFSAFAILLLVCANVTNLLLARDLARRREISTRSALGASRTRLVRQALVETTTLSFLGVVPGCVLAWFLLNVCKSLAPASIPRLAQASLDTRVLLFSILVAALCGIVFGLGSSFANSGLSAFQAQRERLRTAREERNTLALSAGRLTPRPSLACSLKGLLTTGQVAISLMLVSIAALLVQSLWNLQHANTGIGVEHVTIADITVGPAHHPTVRSRQDFFDMLSQRLSQIPSSDEGAFRYDSAHRLRPFKTAVFRASIR